MALRRFFDTQRSPAFPTAGQPFQLSGFALPFNSTAPGGQFTIAPTQYIQFFRVSETPCVYAIYLFEEDGQLVRRISDGGSIYGLGTEGFLHTDTLTDFGTFVANNAGYNLGDGLTYTPETGLATCEETAAYAANTTPLSSPSDSPEASIRAVPTLSEWALIATASLLAFGSLLFIRRRQQYTPTA